MVTTLIILRLYYCRVFNLQYKAPDVMIWRYIKKISLTLTEIELNWIRSGRASSLKCVPNQTCGVVNPREIREQLKVPSSSIPAMKLLSSISDLNRNVHILIILVPHQRAVAVMKPRVKPQHKYQQFWCTVWLPYLFIYRFCLKWKL